MMTPERRRELYNKHSSKITNEELVEYVTGSGVGGVAVHILAEVLSRFKFAIALVEELRGHEGAEGFSDKTHEMLDSWDKMK